MLRPVAITTLILTGVWGIAQADVYRWVDDHGEPHYSDRWVPGSELIKTTKAHPQSSEPAPAAQSRPAASADRTAAQLAERANEQAVKQDVAKTQEAQCKQAQERYKKAIEARRIYKAPKDGDTDRAYMSAAETDAYRLQARNDVTEACGSPPPPQH